MVEKRYRLSRDGEGVGAATYAGWVPWSLGREARDFAFFWGIIVM